MRQMSCALCSRAVALLLPGDPTAPSCLPCCSTAPACLQPGSRLEFVINDGGSDWDKPGHGASNYVAVEPGTYRVKNGKLTRLA
jgi:hypothetical protein